MIYLILFLSGICTAVPMLIPELWFIAFVTLIPFIYIMTEKSDLRGTYKEALSEAPASEKSFITCLKKVFTAEIVRKRKIYLYGFVFGAGYYGVLYSWFTYLYPLEFLDFGPVKSVLAIIVCWAGLAALQSIQLAFVPFFFNILHPKRSVTRVLTFASLWVMMEWSQTQTWLGVPWGRLALTQYTNLAGIQSASIFGSMFISFIIAAVNTLLAEAIYGLIHNSSYIRNTVIISTAIGIVLANQLFGAVRMSVSDYETGESVRVAMIQGNINSNEKWGDDMVLDIISKHISMTREAKQVYNADIIVWTETVIPLVLNWHPELIAQIRNLAVDIEAVIMTGVFYEQEDVPGFENGTYNAVVTFYPDGTFDNTPYFKRHLVPFGEYMPMQKLITFFLPVLADMNAFGNDLIAGIGSEIIDTEYGKIGSLICFDSIYEMLAVDSVRDGAELITILTNDSWYLDSAAVWQHNAHAVMRAVENGRFIVRAANTGVSSVIRPNGKIAAILPPLEEGILCEEVYFNNNQTMYTRVGNIIVTVSALFLIFEVARHVIESRDKNAKNRKNNAQ